MSWNHGLTIMDRLAERRPAAAGRYLDGMLRGRFNRLLVPALRVVLETGPALADALTERIAAESDPALIRAALAEVPNSTLSLGAFGYAATRRLIELETDVETSGGEDAWLERAATLALLAHRARALGHANEALDAATAAVAFSRRMGARFPGQHRAALANALYMQAGLLSDLGRAAEAVRACGTAIRLVRRLAAEAPGEFEPLLCDLLSDQAGYQ